MVARRPTPPRRDAVKGGGSAQLAFLEIHQFLAGGILDLFLGAFDRLGRLGGRRLGFLLDHVGFSSHFAGLLDQGTGYWSGRLYLLYSTPSARVMLLREGTQ
jgi:hypothetical protein